MYSNFINTFPIQYDHYTDTFVCVILLKCTKYIFAIIVHTIFECDFFFLVSLKYAFIFCIIHYNPLF